MKKDKLKKIEAKIKAGLPLTKDDIVFHIVFSKEINLEVARCN